MSKKNKGPTIGQQMKALRDLQAEEMKIKAEVKKQQTVGFDYNKFIDSWMSLGLGKIFISVNPDQLYESDPAAYEREKAKLIASSRLYEPPKANNRLPNIDLDYEDYEDPFTAARKKP